MNLARLRIRHALFLKYIRTVSDITEVGKDKCSVGRMHDFSSGGHGFDPRSWRPLLTSWLG